MPVLLLLASFLLIGCVAPPAFAPRADDARDACDIDALTALVTATPDPDPLDPACVDHLSADLKLDAAQVADVDGADPGRLDPTTRGGGLLRATWLLLALDLGPADGLALDLPTDEPTAGGAVYDYVVGVVTSTRAGRRDDLWARLELTDRTLEIHRPLPGVFGAGVLLHEARHGETGEGHVPCPDDPDRACDDDADGPYVWQAAFYAAAADAADDPALADDLAALADDTRRHVR